MTSEKFCLRWNDFEQNISGAFREIRDDKDFFDITLACEEEQIQAHKIILSACSPFFKKVLHKHQHAHPLLYLKGVKYKDLESVLNFMYHGEVNVAQEELNSFLQVAEDLRVKGLTQNNASDRSAAPAPAPAPKDHHSRLIPKRTYPYYPSSTPPPKKCPRPSPMPRPPPVEDDDIQEVVPVKSEPRDVNLPVSPVVASEQQQPSVNNHGAMVMYEDDDPGAHYVAQKNVMMPQGGNGMDNSYKGRDGSYGGDYGDSFSEVGGQYGDGTVMMGGQESNAGLEDSNKIVTASNANGRDEEETINCHLCNMDIRVASFSGHVREFHRLHEHITNNCPHCDKEFMTKSNLYKHIRSVTKEAAKVMKNNGGRKRYY